MSLPALNGFIEGQGDFALRPEERFFGVFFFFFTSVSFR